MVGGNITEKDLDKLVTYDCYVDEYVCNSYMDDEIWNDVVGFEGFYEVSDKGNIRSIDRKILRKDGVEVFQKGVILKKCLSHGYHTVCLNKNGDRKVVRVHRLVAEAFIPNYENKPYIDHINTIKTDNRVENLRWVTQKENFHNPVSINTWKESIKYRKNPRSRKVVCLNTREVFETIVEAAKRYNIDANDGGIQRCCEGKYKYRGIDPISNEKLVWVYYSDFIRMSDDDIIDKLKTERNHFRKQVRCITTGKMFKDAIDAAKYYGIKCPSTIRDVCNKRKKTTYNGLDSNQRLEWEFVE